jgi:hypothetical protein
MTIEHFIELVRQRLRDWVDLETGALRFVDDLEVVYDPPRHISVTRSALFTRADGVRWAPFLEGSHDWVHANLLTTAEGERVISLRHGSPTQARERQGAPDFSVNVSMEPTPLTILD